MEVETNYLTEGIKITNTDGTEEIIQIPYNLNNVLVKEDDILKILNNYNVKLEKINHIHFFIQSFTHKSYCKKDIFPDEILTACKKEMNNPSNLIELREASYERLEYFGDRVIKLIVSMYLKHM
jgi:dsRNA-specific ribonuclease